MNIAEIKKRTKIGAIKAKKEQIAQERIAKANQLKKARADRRHFRENLNWECKNISAAIEKAADEGQSSYKKGGWHDGELVNAIRVKFEKEGFTVTENSRYVEADNGDPDSGEGSCNAHWYYTLTFKW